MPKTKDAEDLNEYDYYLALAGSKESNYLPIDEILLQSNFLNPEQIAIKNDLFQKLSEEAKDVILMIVNAPAELVDELASLMDGPWIRPMKSRDEEKVFTLKRIKSYLKKSYADRCYSRHGCKSMAGKTIKQIRKFNSQIEKV